MKANWGGPPGSFKAFMDKATEVKARRVAA